MAFVRALPLLLLIGCTRAAPEPLPPPPALVVTSTTADSWEAVLDGLEIKSLDSGATRPLLGMRAKGRPGVFNFWATYCPPCIKEMPMFAEVSAAGHHVVGVSMDAADDEDDVKKTIENNGATYPQVLLSAESMVAVGRMLDEGLPFTLVLDEDGTIVSKHNGMMTKAQVLAALAAAR